VLRRLGHVDKEGIVLTKGRAACEIDTADELLTTELMFNGVFSTLDKHQLVSLASCLIPLGEKTQASQTHLLPVLRDAVEAAPPDLAGSWLICLPGGFPAVLGSP